MTLRVLPAVSAGALALAPCAAAGAQEPAGAALPRIAGGWTLETGFFFDSCAMSGDLELRATADPDVYEGELLARQTCLGVEIEARQTVTARRQGGRLDIESAIVSVEAQPAGAGAGYVPDNFSLSIVDETLMVGGLRFAPPSPDFLTEARFHRDKEPIA